LYWGAFLACVAGLWQRRIPRAFLVVAVPLVWIGFEFIRAVVFSGFGWNAVGVSQFRNLALIQLAEWGGVYAVSAVVVLMNMALTAMAWRLSEVYRRRRPVRLNLELLVGLSVCACCFLVGRHSEARWRRETGRGVEVRIATIQPNIPQDEKWTEPFVNSVYDRIATYTEYALTAGRNLDLIVWPETALPDAVGGSPAGRSFAEDMARRGVPLLAGAMEVEILGGDDAPRKYYNSSFLFGADGEVLGVYRKRHLVPFGEYVPLDKVVPCLQKLVPIGFSCSPGSTGTVFRLAKGPVAFGSLICFEDTIPRLARAVVRNGAALLVNQTNDAWFDGSAAPVQHLAHCVFRCVENRVPAVRAANTGVSCFIDATGRIGDVDILEKSGWGMGVPGFKTAGVVLPAGSRTASFYTRYGDLPLAMPCAVLAGGVFALVVTAEKRKNRLVPGGDPGTGDGEGGSCQRS